MSITPSFPGFTARQTGFLAFVCGLLAYAYPLPAGVCCILVYLVLLLLDGERPPVWAFALIFLLGAGDVAVRVPDPPPVVPDFITARTKVSMDAKVDRVDLRAGQRARVVLKEVRCTLPDGGEVELAGGTVLNWDFPPRIPKAGDRLSARVRIKPVRNFGNPGAWDFEWYWRCRDVYYRTYLRGADKHAELGGAPLGFWERFRERVAAPVLAGLPRTPGGGIAAALLLGDRYRMGLETEDMLRSAGLAHTLALSGLHVGFVAGAGVLLAWVAGFVFPNLLLAIPRPKLAVLTAAPLVLAYMWLGGFTPSLLRAGLMFGAWGVLLLLNRENVLTDGLFLAVGLILLVSPLSVYDLSLQLSALAVTGIAVVLPVLRRFRFKVGVKGRARGRWWKKTLNGAGALLFVSIGATLGILPLQAAYFGEVSPNLLVNVLWLPLLGCVVMPLGLMGMVLSVFPWTAPAGDLLLGGSAGMLDAMLEGLSLLSRTGWVPHWAVMRPDWVQTAGYGLFFAGAACMVFRPWMRSRAVWALIAGGIFMIVPVVPSLMEPGYVEVSMIDVGQGQSVLVTSPKGKRLLIDGGGPGSARFDIGRAVVGPVLARSRMPVVDAVMLTHPDADHYKGLVYLLEAFKVGVFYHSGHGKGGRGMEELAGAAARGGVPSVELCAGETVDLGGGLEAKVLHPPAGYVPESSNDASLVVLLVWKGRGLALVTGDIEKKGLGVLLGNLPLKCDLFVVPHHGSKGSLCPDLYRAVDAEYAFISSGYLNSFNFPHASVVRGIEAAGTEVPDTADFGMLSAKWSSPEQGPTVSVGPNLDAAGDMGGELPNVP